MEFPTGIKFIKEMSKEELIEEVTSNQRAQLEEMTVGSIRHLVADFRIQAVTKRIHLEAGLKVVPGILGGMLTSDEEDEDNAR